MGCFSDIGWVVSHSYTLYGPLLTGAATVLYEGKPVGTPDASAFWRLVEEYKINTMFTAPTALRAIRKDDPDNSHFSRIGQRGGLRSLRALFLAGERSEPAIITMYQDLLKKYGDENSHVIDNWWSSESGSPISGIALVPHAGKSRLTGMKEDHAPLGIKPGSAGKAMPGFDVRYVFTRNYTPNPPGLDTNPDPESSTTKATRSRAGRWATSCWRSRSRPPPSARSGRMKSASTRVT